MKLPGSAGCVCMCMGWGLTNGQGCQYIPCMCRLWGKWTVRSGAVYVYQHVQD